MMKEGIYNISNRQYHQSEGISNSGIGRILVSPAAFKHKQSDWKSDALRTGSPFHTLLLEPSNFDNEYIVVDEIPSKAAYHAITNKDDFVVCELEYRRGNDWKAFKEDNEGKLIFLSKEIELAKSFIKESDEKLVISTSDLEKAKRLVETTKSNKKAMLIIDNPNTIFEQSIYWVDEQTQELCKIRPDIILDDKMYDLKSTRDAGVSSFTKSIKQYSYYRQAAFYLRGAKELGLEINSFGFIATDDLEPATSTVFHRLGDSAIERGIEEFERGLLSYSACKFDGNWHGKPEEYDEISPYFFKETA